MVIDRADNAERVKRWGWLDPKFKAAMRKQSEKIVNGMKRKGRMN